MTTGITEVDGLLLQAGSCVLNSSGQGSVILEPSNARQRWVVKSVAVATNQAATATVVPVAGVAKNNAVVSELSAGLTFGQSWSGNLDSFTGQVDISPADYLTVFFKPPPGASGAQIATLAGVTCYATVTGTRHTRRG